MGNTAQASGQSYLCTLAEAHASFPLKVSVEAARAASAAALTTATATTVVGYTMLKTKEAGASSVCLQLPSHSDMLCLDAAAVSVRAQGKMSFLAGIAAPLKQNALEVVVLARPDRTFGEVTQLDESMLTELFPLHSLVDVRVVRTLLPYEPGNAEWLSDRLVLLAAMVESHFGLPKPSRVNVPGYFASFVDKKGVVSWLSDAGVTLKLPEETP